MGVAGKAPASITGGLMLQLEAEGQKEGEDALEKRFAIAQQVEVVASSRKSTVMVRLPRVVLAAVPMCAPLSSGLVRWWDTMGVTRCNLKSCVKGSERHH